jgi:hypothetical protein
MSNTHTIERYKNLGIQEVCHTVKFPELQARVGMIGWGNKKLSIKHTQVLEFRLHEQQPLNETILAVLVVEAYGEALAEAVVAPAVGTAAGKQHQPQLNSILGQHRRWKNLI